MTLPGDGIRQEATDGEEAGRLLRIRDVATRLRVSRRTVQGWAASGRLPVLRLSPRTVRVSPEALNEFLKASAEQSQ